MERENSDKWAEIGEACAVACWKENPRVFKKECKIVKDYENNKISRKEYIEKLNYIGWR